MIMTVDSPSSPEYEDFQSKPHHHKKKRVGKACDSCRIKKTKCDGKKPCGKCLSDNKICVFTEKRKSKDKNHPQGYVELLETRIDLISKALEKLILLSTPYLKFLKDLQVLDNEVIPINEVVQYLINKEGLLKNHPIEWENGAYIAANLSSDKDGIQNASRQFALHSQHLDEKAKDQERKPKNPQEQEQEQDQDEEDDEEDEVDEIKLEYEEPIAKQQLLSLLVASSLFLHVQIKKENNDDEERIGLNHNIPPPIARGGSRSGINMNDSASFSLRKTDSFSRLPDLDRQNSISEQLSLDDFQLSEFSSGGAIASSAAAMQGGMFSFLEYDSDRNTPRQQFQNPSPMSQFEYFDQQHPLPELNRGELLSREGSGSVTSLTNKFENHEIQSPIANSVAMATSQSNQTSSSSVRRSSSISRPYSPNLIHQQKLKNGHVHKPVTNSHHSHHHSHTQDEFRIKRINSSSSITTPTPETFTNSVPPKEGFEYNTSVLPSEPFRFQQPGYDGLSIMDTENMETMLIKNPFLHNS